MTTPRDAIKLEKGLKKHTLIKKYKSYRRKLIEFYSVGNVTGDSDKKEVT